MPASGRHSRLYCARFGASFEMSFVTTPWRNAAAASPRTSKRPVWLTSKMPAAFLTDSCSSLTLEYCWGISQPAKSTMRPPAATWRSYSDVRLLAIALGPVADDGVQVDLTRLQVLEQLLVVPAPRIRDH